jgi:hypothetical protein
MNTARPGSLTILRVAFKAIRLHPRLLLFPLISGALGIVLIGLAAIFSLAIPGEVVGADLGCLLSIFADPHATDTSTRIRAGIASTVFVGYGVGLVAMICSVGLARAAMEAMAGREFTVRDQLRHAFRRLPAIATVFVLGTWIRGRMKGGKGGRRGLAKAFLEMAWWAVSYLVVPVLAREDKGGFESLFRSAKLFRDTWKEAFIGRVAVGWLTLPFLGLVGLSIGGCVWLGVEDPRILLVAIAIPITVGGLGALLLTTLDTVYRTALYVFATEGVVPEPFDDPALHDIWEVPRVIDPQVE